VGPEHLSKRGLPLGFLLLLMGCSPGAPPAVPSHVSLGPAGKHGPHVQIIRALPLPERRALVEKFRARNGAWTVTLGAGTTPDDVDPIRGVVRRATRDTGASDPTARAPVTEETAIADTAAFLTKNADLLGFSAKDVPALDLVAGPAKTMTYGTWVVHARGASPMRGYEGFEAVTSKIDVLAYLGDEGGVRYFVNLSHVHPRLSIDTAPLLGPDDPRLLERVLGRVLFAVVDDPTRPEARVRELRRIPLGTVMAADVHPPRLTIDVSPGPRFAYVSYTLAYAVDVVKDHTPFRFVVDADTGALLEDPVVPIVTPSDDDPE